MLASWAGDLGLSCRLRVLNWGLVGLGVYNSGSRVLYSYMTTQPAKGPNVLEQVIWS